MSPLTLTRPAGVISRTLTAPLDRLKTMDQVGATSQTGVAERLRALYRTGGVSSLLQGNSANAFKSMPEFGIKFGCNDYMRATICRDAHAPSISPAEPLLAPRAASASTRSRSRRRGESAALPALSSSTAPLSMPLPPPFLLRAAVASIVLSSALTGRSPARRVQDGRCFARALSRRRPLRAADGPGRGPAGADQGARGVARGHHSVQRTRPGAL